MKDSAMIEKLNELIKPIVESKGCELYHIEFVKESGENYLRVYIDKEEGISLEDCEKVSRPISDMLDIEDPVPSSYYLEVSSPGMYRELYNNEHFKKNIGNRVIVKLSSLHNSKKQYEGVLSGFSDTEITIKHEEEDIVIPKDKIKGVNLNGDK